MKFKKLFQGNYKLILCATSFACLGVRPATATDYPTTILADKPAAYYRFEEAPGSASATDSSGNGFNGAINYDLDINATPDYPKLAQDGIDTNSYLFHNYTDTNDEAHASDVDVTYNATLNPQGPFSAEFWARATSDANNYDVPLGSFGGYGTSSGWDFYQTPGTPGSWVFNVPSAGAFIQTSQVIKNQWTHLVGVYDGTNLIFYINGMATATVSGAGYLANAVNDLYIGAEPPSGWGNFEGYIDEVAIYTNALTAAQVLNHYQVGTNSFSTNPAPPIVLVDAGATNSNPASMTVNAGSTATFDPIVVGGTPLAYQWFTNGAAEGGATNSLLSFTASSAQNNSTYFVVVTNSFGSSTSAVATLTVVGNLIINSGPQSITRNVGSYAAFHVTASGASPISYQWSVSTDSGTTFTPISAATNPTATKETLWLSNVQLAQNNYEYSVLVTGPANSTTPTPATLSVQARAVNVPLTGYGAVVAADKPVAYWRLDEANGSATAVDAIGSFDGTYTPNSGSVNYDVLPVGIPDDTDPAIGLTNGATIQVPFAPELNPELAWSVETWVQPSSLGANGGDYRVVLSSEYHLYSALNNNQNDGWYIYQQPNNSFAFVPQPGNVFISAGSIVAGDWYHLVVTDDGTNFNLYINGVLAVAPFPLASADFIPDGDGINGDGTPGLGAGLGNFVFGQRTDQAFNTFEGNMDDTAVYNYALSPQQIKNHFLNSTRVSIVGYGSSVVISWPTGTLQSSTNVSGPYLSVASAVSPYTNSISGGQKFFRVQLQ